MKKKKSLRIAALALAGVMAIPLVSACTPEQNVSTLSGDLLQSQYIDWSGRNYYDPSTELNYFFYAASGFTVDFYGTSLSAQFYSTWANAPAFVVSVDGMLYSDDKIKLDKDAVNSTTGKVVLDEQIVKLSASTLDSSAGEDVHTVTLVDGLSLGAHSVTLYKMGEASDNTTALKSLSTDKYFYTQAPSDKLNIEIIGSSGITGFGALSYSTQSNIGRGVTNSFGAASLAGLTAQMLYADMSFMSMSGWTLCNDGLNKAISSIYDNIGRTQNGNFKIDGQTVKTTHTENVDIVILNIGGNDSSSVDLATLQPAEVKSFTAKLLQTHPTAKIVWTGRGNYGSRISQAVNQINNSNVIYVGAIEQYGGSDKTNDPHYGASNHASIRSQLHNANMIVTALKDNFNISAQRTLTIQEI